MVKVLAVGGVNRTAILQALEDDKGGVEEGHGEQDQGQHERNDDGRLDGRLDGHHAHQEAEQVGTAIAHEAGGGREVVYEETERRTGRQRREHTRFDALEIERDDGKRAGDDHAHARGEPIDTVGEVDNIHHHDQPDHGERRSGVRGARFGEGKHTHEWQGDRLHDDTEAHDDDRCRDLPGELYDRRQVEAIVEGAHRRDQRGGDKHPVPEMVARAVACGQERQHGNEHSREDRKATEQRRGATRQAPFARFVHGAHRGR
jgi:hypothetical protein